MIWLVGLGVFLLLAIAVLCLEMYHTLHHQYNTIISFSRMIETNREICQKLDQSVTALEKIERHAGRLAKPMHEADRWYERE